MDLGTVLYVLTIIPHGPECESMLQIVAWELEMPIIISTWNNSYLDGGLGCTSHNALPRNSPSGLRGEDTLNVTSAKDT